MTHCVLLNADYSFLNVVDWKRAMRMIAKGKVQIVQYSERVVATAEGVFFPLDKKNHDDVVSNLKMNGRSAVGTDICPNG